MDLDVPSGDVFIHAGDIMKSALNYEELGQINRWLESLDFEHKILVPGNHDGVFELADRQWIREQFPMVHILFGEAVELDGVRFFGSPWTPPFLNWYFMMNETRIKKVLNEENPGCDVLITHGPPLWILDGNDRGESCGSIAVLEHVKRTNPALHFFGHIHEAYGREGKYSTLFFNVSAMDERYRLVNAAVEVEYLKPAVEVEL